VARRSRLWRIVRLAAGWSLVALGIVGLVLPILQGVALILAGLAVLATDLPWARRWLHGLRDRVRKWRKEPGGGGDAPGG
jgi:uncharacterized membrane protein YbaN (DUF454 family)